MNIKEQLIAQFNSKITELDNQIDKEELNKLLELKEIVIKLNNKIATILPMKKNGKKLPKDIRLRKDDIASLKFTEILELFPNFSNDALEKLAHYLKLSGSIFFDLNKEEVLNNIKEILDKLLKEIEIKETFVSTINEKKQQLQELINSLNNDYENLFKNNINKIVAFLQQQGKTEIEILKYIRELAIDIELTISQNKINELQDATNIEENPEEEVEILEENQEDIKQKIINSLNNNGYSNLVIYFEEKQTPKIEKIKEELFKYGNIENIEGIITTFKNYNINLLEEVNQGNLFKIITLFLYSSKQNLETIFNLALETDICICKYDELGNLILDDQGKPRINFNLLLEHVSRFINRKRRYKKRGNETIEINIDESEIGNLEDYIKNIRFFQNLGVDIKELFKDFEEKNKKIKKRQSTGSYFDMPHSKILKNKHTFDFYGIPKEAYLSTLSCFIGTDLADTIDMYIELDIFDYLKNRMSRVTDKPDDPIFYRIVRTYQLASILPNPENLPLRQNAKQFLFSQWTRNKDGSKIPAGFKKYIYNPSLLKEFDEKQLDTKINAQNGSVITNCYKNRIGEVLTEDQVYNFTYFDNLVKNNKNNDNDTIELIDEKSPIIRTINIQAKPGIDSINVLEFGEVPNKIRISQIKFYRIYNTLCKNGLNLENDRDCVLYALTYNSILTVGEFNVIKQFVDNVFKNIPQKSGRVAR